MSAAQSRLKVLVFAYACNPYRGSEEGVGWSWVQSIARHHDLHVVTADFHRDAIHRHEEEAKGGDTGITWHFVPPRAWHYRPTPWWRRIESSALKPIMNLAYSTWQADALHLAKALHRKHGFDLAHLLTYVGFRFPGRFWELGIPFVWGPIGGLEDTPRRFLPMMGRKGVVYYGGRNLINGLQRRLLPGPRRAFEAARGGVIAATRGIQRAIQRQYRVDADVICEIGAPASRTDSPAAREAGQPLGLGWSGLHLVGKALPLLLDALALVGARVDWRLTVLGEGNCTANWQAHAERLGLSDRIEWLGWVPRADALERMGSLHAFVITSLKDLTSTVTLEALAQGVPVVCLDHCGFADVVTADCGIKVPVESPEQVHRDLARAIEQLDADESLRRRLAAGALQRAVEYTWEDKGRRVDAIYRRKLAQASEP